MSISSNNQGRFELHEALSTKLAENELISNTIINMFATELDRKEDPDLNKRWQRFFKAQELYQNVWNKGKRRISQAIFYRLADSDQFEAEYALALQKIEEILRNHVKQLNELKKTPTVQAMVQFIKKEFIENVSAVSPDTLTEKKRQKMRSIVASNILKILNQSLHQYFNKSLNQIESESDLEIPFDYWLNKQMDTIKGMSTSTFYAVEDVAEAEKEGTIYDPDEAHNWGVNVAWTLAVARNLIPIKVLSELNMQNASRSSPNPNKSLNPSAFSLEISVVIKMGYGLNIENGAITLVPPSTLSHYTTTGEPGNGVLPTLQEQSDIFRRCVRARELHTLLSLNKVEELRESVYAACTDENIAAKEDFLKTLELLEKGESLTPIFDALSQREIDSFKLALDSDQQKKQRPDTLPQFEDYQRQKEAESRQSSITPPTASQGTSQDKQKDKSHSPRG